MVFAHRIGSHRRRVCLFSAALWLLAPGLGRAAAQADDDEAAVEISSRAPSSGVPTVAVVVLSNAAGRPFDGAVEHNLLANLRPTLAALPMPAVHGAVAAVHGTAATLHLPATLLAIGRRLHVPYIMVVEAVGKPRPTHVFVGLVDVHHNKTMLAHREAIARGTLDGATGRTLATRIAASIGPAAHRGLAPPAPRPVPKQAPVETPIAEVAEPDAPAEPRPVHPAHPHHQRSQTAALEGAKHEEMMPGLLPRARLGAGFELLQRVARLNTPAVQGVSAPCYCGNKQNSQPFFPAAVVSGEVSTGVFTKGRRRLQDGIGLRVDLMLAPVKTRIIKQTGTSQVSSLIYTLDAALFYRLAWFANRPLTPDVRFSAGLHKFAFPLKGTQFTGVDYIAPQIAVGLDVPLQPQLGLFVNLAARPALKAGKQASALLGHAKAGFGFAAQAGIRGGFKHAVFDLAFQFDRYKVPFTGQTNLPGMVTGSDGNPVQFTNVKLTDQLLGIMARASIAL